MDVSAERTGDEILSREDESVTHVMGHEPRPGKVVLTERNNCDGWIASDLAVELEP